uniref:Coiled-coil domain-containing protein 12 n=1 Tax=Lygus hesperus TaxID=30085 RepID=A0A0A9VWF0_LYGHE
MIMEDKVGALEDEAMKRKERLKALRKKHDEGVSGELKTGGNGRIPKPIFRSYTPADELLKDTVLDPARPGDVESEIQEQLEAAQTRVVIEELDITTLAPRKPDWDLKRDIAKKLEKLEKRTQRAIAELIRDRLKSEQTDLATQVTIGSQSQNYDDDND